MTAIQTSARTSDGRTPRPLHHWLDVDAASIHAYVGRARVRAVRVGVAVLQAAEEVGGDGEEVQPRRVLRAVRPVLRGDRLGLDAVLVRLVLEVPAEEAVA